ncbi:MAG: OmpA family protein [Myxococcales bacterium]|nr:OmpA family protein [Myxococcales bacterium]
MIAMWWGLAATSAAQVVTAGDVPQINAQMFRPTLDTAQPMTVDVASMPQAGGSARVWMGYHDDLLVYASEGQQRKLVANVVQLNVLGAWAWGPVRAGVDIPVLLFADGDATQPEAGLSDVALDARVAIFGTDAPLEFPVDLGIQGRLSVPTATVDTALGARRSTASLAAVASTDLGPVLVALNLGAQLGPRVDLENVSLNDAVDLRAAAAYSITERTSVSAEVAGRVGLGDANRAGLPIEGLLAGSHQLTDSWQVRGGVGRGFTPGIGSPDLRLLVGVAWHSAPRLEAVTVDRDLDDDGIVDELDRCPSEPEDRDGHLDDDGCPDAGAVVRISVVTPDGTPIDTARGGVAPVGEEAPVERFRGGFAQLPLPEGSWQVRARAPGFEPGTAQVEVPDGPALDAVVTLQPKRNARVRVTRDRIELADSVYFRTSSATISRGSLPLLDEAAQILLDNPEIALLSIEGHTDSRGNDAFNLQLSRDRAASVLEYFVAKGVSRSRLVSAGFGEEQPLDTAATEAAHARNRRVDFKILRWEGR